jgi:hypothetical protein
LAHVLSTGLEAIFCMGCVVLVYQVVLRCFGRQRLESLITGAQVVVALAAVLGGQLPQLLSRSRGRLDLAFDAWWITLLPSAWFAGIDDALGGTGAGRSWLAAGIGAGATALVVAIAFGKLAGDYHSALQAINEAAPTPKRGRAHRRWVGAILNAPPLRWWLRDPVSRAATLLSVAYLLRDRDVKVRVYPGLVPILVLPLVFLWQGRGGHEFGIALCGGYAGLIPLLALNLLRYSQQWQAADLFRVAPIAGPGPLCHGARRAVLLFLTLPFLAAMGLIAWWACRDSRDLLLMLPGVMALPAFAMVPCIGGRAVPLSEASEEAKSASRGLVILGAMAVVLGVSGVGLWAW